MLLQRLAVTTCFATKDNEAAKAAVNVGGGGNWENPLLTPMVTAGVEKAVSPTPAAAAAGSSVAASADEKINVVIALRDEPQSVFGKHRTANTASFFKNVFRYLQSMSTIWKHPPVQFYTIL